MPQGKDINEYVCLLAGKDKNAIPGILQGLCVDAPVIHQANPENVDITDPTATEYSSSIISLAANLAAKEKSQTSLNLTGSENAPVKPFEKQATKEENIPDHPGTSGQHGAQPSFLAADLAADEKKETGKTDLSVVKNGGDVEITIGDRVYRIRGLAKNQTFEVMRVNVRVMNPDGYHIDTLDLYNARHRTAYINTAAGELRVTAEVVKKDLDRMLLALEELQDEEIRAFSFPSTMAFTYCCFSATESIFL